MGKDEIKESQTFTGENSRLNKGFVAPDALWSNILDTLNPPKGCSPPNYLQLNLKCSALLKVNTLYTGFFGAVEGLSFGCIADLLSSTLPFFKNLARVQELSEPVVLVSMLLKIRCIAVTSK